MELLTCVKAERETKFWPLVDFYFLFELPPPVRLQHNLSQLPLHRSVGIYPFRACSLIWSLTKHCYRAPSFLTSYPASCPSLVLFPLPWWRPLVVQSLAVSVHGCFVFCAGCLFYVNFFLRFSSKSSMPSFLLMYDLPLISFLSSASLLLFLRHAIPSSRLFLSALNLFL